MRVRASALVYKLQRVINVAHNPVSGWVVLAISLLVTFAAYWFTSFQVHVRAEENFQFRASEITLRIRQRLLLYEQALQGGRGLFNASDAVSRTEWKNYVASLQLTERLPGIQGLGFAMAVPPEAVSRVEAQVRAEGFPDFRIHPDEPRDFYTSILYLEPFDWRNRRAFGFDMWSNPVRREAMMRALDSGEPAASGVITLLQETNRNVQHGFLIYIAVYKTAETPDSPEARRSELRGWVYAPFRTGDLMQGVLGEADAGIIYEIHDGTSVLEHNTLPETHALLDSNGGLARLVGSGAPIFSASEQLDIFGRQWQLNFAAPQRSFTRDRYGRQPLYILLAGIVVDTLLFYVLVSLGMINRHARRTELRLQRDFVANQEALARQTHLVETMEREAQAFFQLAPGALLVVSQRGVIIRANHAAHDLFRHAEGTLMGRRVEDLLPDSAVPGHAAVREAFWASYFSDPSERVIEVERTVIFKRQGGEEFPSAVSVMPVEVRGEIHAVVAVRDLSQQKQLEKNLADAKEKAESASRAKSEFVANMSHEIRTPLNAVLGAAQLLEKTDPNPVQQKYIRMIRSSGEALLGVINDILDFSKIEAGRMELTSVSFSLDEMLARLAVMMSVTVGEKDVEMVVQVDSAVRRQVVGDPVRLQQVLINLISNAIKFTESGEVVLSLELEEVDAEGRQKLRFAVRDTGMGMSLMQQTRIFNAFSQADASITRRFGGTGLGLVICNSTLGLMGARLQVLSEPGVGSEFGFSLWLPSLAPADRATGSSDRAPGPADLLPRRDPSGPCRLLLIDANRETHLSIQAIAKTWGADLVACASWEEAQALPAGSRAPDFVLIGCNQLEPGEFNAKPPMERLQLPPDCATVLLLRNHQRALQFMTQDQRLFDAGLTKPVLGAALLNALLDAAAHRTGASLPATQTESPGNRGPLRGVRLLLVEDNIFNQTVAQGLLEDLGAAVTIAGHGGEAVTQVRAHAQAFDLVLMDIQMPVMDGLTATRILREQGVALPIIAMTAGVLGSEREQCLAAGMNDLVPKPIDQELLQQVVLRWLAAEPEGVQPMQPEPQVFNAARLESLARGRKERLLSLVESLAGLESEARNALAAITVQLAERDLDAAAKTLHRIRGALANYGGEQVAQGLRELELLVHEAAPPEPLETALAGVQRQLAHYLEQARHWCGAQQRRVEAD